MCIDAVGYLAIFYASLCHLIFLKSHFNRAHFSFLNIWPWYGPEVEKSIQLPTFMHWSYLQAMKANLSIANCRYIYYSLDWLVSKNIKYEVTLCSGSRTMAFCKDCRNLSLSISFIQGLSIQTSVTVFVDTPCIVHHGKEFKPWNCYARDIGELAEWFWFFLLW